MVRVRGFVFDVNHALLIGVVRVVLDCRVVVVTAVVIMTVVPVRVVMVVVLRVINVKVPRARHALHRDRKALKGQARRDKECGEAQRE